MMYDVHFYTTYTFGSFVMWFFSNIHIVTSLFTFLDWGSYYAEEYRKVTQKILLFCSVALLRLAFLKKLSRSII